MTVHHHDFIIVGGGPAGASLASRLAKTAKAPSVLLIEAGGENADHTARVLADRYVTLMTPNMDWGYSTVPQEHLNGRQIPYFRGKGLGGSSAINFAAWTIGPKDDYEEWARIVGDDSFNWQNARRRLDRIEAYNFDIDQAHQRYANPATASHGHDGPIQIEYTKEWENSFEEVLNAVEEFGIPLNPDANSGDPLGACVIPSTSYRGMRITARTAFLEDVPPNLTIVTNSPVSKVKFDGKRAIGIVSYGKDYIAEKEIVLCAGALDTPKILLLSGVGPKDEIKTHGIDCVHNLPGVGKNLQDHLLIPAIVQVHEGTNARAALYNNPDALAAARKQFNEDGTGPLSIFYNALTMSWLRNDSLYSTPEFQTLPNEIRSHIRRSTVPAWELISHTPPLTPTVDPALEYMTLLAMLCIPQSTGTITLASADPHDKPLCDPNFFSHALDRRNAIDAVHKVIELLKTPQLAKVTQHPFQLPLSTEEEDILSFVRENAISTMHMSCTAKMGKEKDEMACVDTAFKVRGLEGLRVADMSVAPFIPNCHTVAYAYLIGETAAERLIGEYELDA